MVLLYRMKNDYNFLNISGLSSEKMTTGGGPEDNSASEEDFPSDDESTQPDQLVDEVSVDESEDELHPDSESEDSESEDELRPVDVTEIEIDIPQEPTELSEDTITELINNENLTNGFLTLMGNWIVPESTLEKYLNFNFSQPWLIPLISDEKIIYVKSGSSVISAGSQRVIEKLPSALYDNIISVKNISRLKDNPNILISSNKLAKTISDYQSAGYPVQADKNHGIVANRHVMAMRDGDFDFRNINLGQQIKQFEEAKDTKNFYIASNTIQAVESERVTLVGLIKTRALRLSPYQLAQRTDMSYDKFMEPIVYKGTDLQPVKNALIAINGFFPANNFKLKYEITAANLLVLSDGDYDLFYKNINLKLQGVNDAQFRKLVKEQLNEKVLKYIDFLKKAVPDIDSVYEELGTIYKVESLLNKRKLKKILDIYGIDFFSLSHESSDIPRVEYIKLKARRKHFIREDVLNSLDRGLKFFNNLPFPKVHRLKLKRQKVDLEECEATSTQPLKEVGGEMCVQYNERYVTVKSLLSSMKSLANNKSIEHLEKMKELPPRSNFIDIYYDRLVKSAYKPRSVFKISTKSIDLRKQKFSPCEKKLNLNPDKTVEILDTDGIYYKNGYGDATYPHYRCAYTYIFICCKHKYDQASLTSKEFMELSYITEGKYCSYCGEILVPDYDDLEFDAEGRPNIKVGNALTDIDDPCFNTEEEIAKWFCYVNKLGNISPEQYIPIYTDFHNSLKLEDISIDYKDPSTQKNVNALYTRMRDGDADAISKKLKPIRDDWNKISKTDKTIETFKSQIVYDHYRVLKYIDRYIALLKISKIYRKQFNVKDLVNDITHYYSLKLKLMPNKVLDYSGSEAVTLESYVRDGAIEIEIKSQVPVQYKKEKLYDETFIGNNSQLMFKYIADITARIEELLQNVSVAHRCFTQLRDYFVLGKIFKFTKEIKFIVEDEELIELGKSIRKLKIKYQDPILRIDQTTKGTVFSPSFTKLDLSLSGNRYNAPKISTFDISGRVDQLLKEVDNLGDRIDYVANLLAIESFYKLPEANKTEANYKPDVRFLSNVSEIDFEKADPNTPIYTDILNNDHMFTKISLLKRYIIDVSRVHLAKYRQKMSVSNEDVYNIVQYSKSCYYNSRHKLDDIVKILLFILFDDIYSVIKIKLKTKTVKNITSMYEKISGLFNENILDDVTKIFEKIRLIRDTFYVSKGDNVTIFDKFVKRAKKEVNLPDDIVRAARKDGILGFISGRKAFAFLDPERIPGKDEGEPGEEPVVQQQEEDEGEGRPLGADGETWDNEKFGEAEGINDPDNPDNAPSENTASLPSNEFIRQFTTFC
jgi:hypothetical protein